MSLTSNEKELQGFDMHTTLQYVRWLHEYAKRIRGNWSRHNPALAWGHVAVQMSGLFPMIPTLCYCTSYLL